MPILWLLAGFRRVGHSGSIATYKSQVWLYPDHGYGIFIDSNGPASATTTRALILILQYISDALLGQQQWLNVSTVCSFPYPWQPDVLEEDEDMTHDAMPLPNDTIPDLHRYAGIYTNLGFGNVAISVPEKDMFDEHSGEDVHTPQRLRMRMGQAFDAYLYFNASTHTFYTNFTDKYWYYNERIPLRFQLSTDKRLMDKLFMPMHPPYDIVTPAVFVRGMDPEQHFIRTQDNYFCGSASGCIKCLLRPSSLILFILLNLL